MQSMMAMAHDPLARDGRELGAVLQFVRVASLLEDEDSAGEAVATELYAIGHMAEEDRQRQQPGSWEWSGDVPRRLACDPAWPRHLEGVSTADSDKRSTADRACLHRPAEKR